jgi:hypothetical protein
MASNGSSPNANGTPNVTPYGSAGGWPTVPPVPVPVKPDVAPEPDEQPPVATARVPAVDDDSPTMVIDAEALAAAVGAAPRPLLGALRRPLPRLLADSSPVAVLREAARRRAALANEADPHRSREEIWPRRFAFGSGLVIVLVLTVVSLPLWIVLWRITGVTSTPAKDIIALCLMIMAGFLTAAALWAIVVEMRARVRMVDALARTGDREGLFEAGSTDLGPARQATGETTRIPSRPVDFGLRGDERVGRSLGTFITGPIHAPSATALHVASIAPITVPILPPPGTPGAPPAAPALRSGLFPPRFGAQVEDQSADAAAMLDASGRLLASFSSVLKSFGQLPAQLATLTVALALFVSATILSLH